MFSSSSTVIVNLTTGTITATNLAISEIGIDIILTNGSIKCSFGTSSSSIGAAQNLWADITTLTTSGINAVNNLQVIEANIDGRSYATSSSSDVSSSNIITAVGYQIYVKKARGQPPVNESEKVTPSLNQAEPDSTHEMNLLQPTNVDSHNPSQKTVTSPNLLNLDTNEHDAPLSNNKKEPLVPSAALSVTLFENMLPINNVPNEPMPPVVFIQFD
ncbi:unnamed protein product [Rotaria magnacalcarata]|uniref:Uncharacterized protein n=1 Tax=Rotaria magnacalcarata TaxID=392030 RepID=A0A816V0P8_9BILA|nr:unnamed protein product [Rotaria magnacalcarata]CAF3863722.1 unnamed protein product [Rotaria magnacalcarata]CAF3947496.1 unnamed protein product [Rotaria magnacalcarata]